jgi:hypothetical protein
VRTFRSPKYLAQIVDPIDQYWQHSIIAALLTLYSGDVPQVASILKTNTLILWKHINKDPALTELVTTEHSHPALTEAQTDSALKVAAIRDARGDIARAAKTLGLNPKSFRAEARRDAELRATVAEELERVADRAQNNVAVAIESGDLATSKWYLDRIGAKRGFTETKNVNQNTTHLAMSLDTASSANLIERLLGNLSSDGQLTEGAIEAEFEILDPNDRIAVESELRQVAERVEAAEARELDSQ